VLRDLRSAAVASSAAIFAASIGGPHHRARAQSLGAYDRADHRPPIIRDLYDREQAASMIGLVTSGRRAHADGGR